MSIYASCDACKAGQDLPDDMAGKTVRCKACGRNFVAYDSEPPEEAPLTALPAAPQPAPRPRPPSPRPRPRRPDPEPQAGPRPQPRGSKTWIILLCVFLGGGLFVLCGGVIGVVLLVRQAMNPVALTDAWLESRGLPPAHIGVDYRFVRGGPDPTARNYVLVIKPVNGNTVTRVAIDAGRIGNQGTIRVSVPLAGSAGPFEVYLEQESFGPGDTRRRVSNTLTVR
jgi:hypothetical protein